MLLFLLFVSGQIGLSAGIMYDAYMVNETDFVQATPESYVNVNRTMSHGLCALNTRYNGLKAFKIQDGTCLMGNISLTGKPDLNGTVVYVEADHARATLGYGKFDLFKGIAIFKLTPFSCRLFTGGRQFISRQWFC